MIKGLHHLIKTTDKWPLLECFKSHVGNEKSEGAHPVGKSIALDQIKVSSTTILPRVALE